MKNYLSIILLLLTSGVYAQVGINNNDPHPSTILDVSKSDGKAMLLPSVTSAQRKSLGNTLVGDKKKAMAGFILFDKEENQFFFWDTQSDTLQEDNLWVPVNPLVRSDNGSYVFRPINEGAKVAIGKSEATEKLDVGGSIKADSNIVAGGLFMGRGAVPVGTIVMWSGDPNNLPPGWELCDGVSGRPNLKGRFIVGYDKDDSDYNQVGKKGPRFSDADGVSNGQNTQDAKAIKLTEGQMPAHNHYVDLRTSTNGKHSHRYDMKDDNNSSDDNSGWPETGWAGGELKVTSTQEAGDHSHDVKGNTQNKGGNQEHENRPPFYTLAYIIFTGNN